MPAQTRAPGADSDIEVTDARTGQPADMSVLEETGTAFDPTTQHRDLTKDEKRRTTALLMGIQAYRDFIIKDAEYLREVAAQGRHDEGFKIRSATEDGIIVAAIKFDLFIQGRLELTGKESYGLSATVPVNEPEDGAADLSDLKDEA